MTDGPDREGPLVPPENGTETAANGQDGNARQNAAPSARSTACAERAAERAAAGRAECAAERTAGERLSASSAELRGKRAIRLSSAAVRDERICSAAVRDERICSAAVRAGHAVRPIRVRRTPAERAGERVPAAELRGKRAMGYPPPPYGMNGYAPPQYALPPQYVYPPQVQTPLSTLSILGFVFVFVMSLVGLILSIVAYSNAKREGDLRSKNFSQIGIILSAVFLGLSVVIGIIVGIAVAAAVAGGYGVYY